MPESILRGLTIVNRIHAMWLTRLAQGLENWALPPTCALCAARGAAPGFDLCADCEADLPLTPEAPLHLQVGMAGGEQGQRPGGGLDARWSAFVYAFPVDAMIRELKFAGQVHYARILGLACLRRLRNVDWPFGEVDALLPVPLHRSRLSERGFNQAREIALPIARGLGLPLRDGLARRSRATAPQTLLSGPEPRRNLCDAFDVRSVAGMSLLLVDDVTTSGATLTELARALKRAGARQVWGLTVACAGPGVLPSR